MKSKLEFCGFLSMCVSFVVTYAIESWGEKITFPTYIWSLSLPGNNPKILMTHTALSYFIQSYAL